MSKGKKKSIRTNDRIRTSAIYWTAEQVGVSPQYIYGLLNGNSKAFGRAEEILEVYRKKYAEIKGVLANA